MKWYKVIIKLLIAVILFGLIISATNYILLDDTNSYTRVAMHELKNPQENIDVLYVGSSHVYRSLIPSITDEYLEQYSFNAGTSSQQLDGSLAMIKEASAYNDIKTVYLELYYMIYNSNSYEERTELTSTYIISDYMAPTYRKVEFLLNASSKDYWVNGFISGRRNWTKLFELNYIADIFKKKSQVSYQDFQLNKAEGEVEYYVNRGFVANENVVSSDNLLNATAYGSIPLDEEAAKNCDWRNSLEDIITFCKNNNIELKFFIAPEPEWTLVGKGNYQQYHEFIQEIANENGIDFADFNLCKNTIFDTNDIQFFKDEDHLNLYGAEHFSQIFSQYYAGKYTKEELFHESFDKKIEHNSIGLYGVAEPKSSEDEIEHYYLITDNNSSNEYKIILTTETGSHLYQDFSNNTDIYIPADETGTMTILWKDKTVYDELRTITVEY